MSVQTLSFRFSSNKLLLPGLFAALLSSTSLAQEPAGNSRLSSWLQLQVVPSFTLTSRTGESAFGFEWEASPLLYSFGMTRMVSPWHSFIVEPPARFTGSVEVVASGQLHTMKIGKSYFAGSLQLLGHIPLIERGEYLALNLGTARYYDAAGPRTYAVAGLSMLFGFVHVNIKRSFHSEGWMGSFELRLF